MNTAIHRRSVMPPPRSPSVPTTALDAWESDLIQNIPNQNPTSFSLSKLRDQARARGSHLSILDPLLADAVLLRRQRLSRSADKETRQHGVSEFAQSVTHLGRAGHPLVAQCLLDLPQATTALHGLLIGCAVNAAGSAKQIQKGLPLVIQKLAHVSDSGYLVMMNGLEAGVHLRRRLVGDLSWSQQPIVRHLRQAVPWADHDPESHRASLGMAGILFSAGDDGPSAVRLMHDFAQGMDSAGDKSLPNWFHVDRCLRWAEMRVADGCGQSLAQDQRLMSSIMSIAITGCAPTPAPHPPLPMEQDHQERALVLMAQITGACESALHP